MTTTPHGLADRAIAEARHLRTTDPARFAARHNDWPQWTRRADLARTIAWTLGIRTADVMVTDDPDRHYGLSHQQPGDLITVTDPVTAHVVRFVPDFTAQGNRWLLIDECPGCGGTVPMARVATVADLGDYLDPDNDTRFDHLPLEHFGDPAHRTDCSHRD